MSVYRRRRRKSKARTAVPRYRSVFDSAYRRVVFVRLLSAAHHVAAERAARRMMGVRGAGNRLKCREFAIVRVY